MNYNRTIIGGRLTRNPELKYTNSGMAVCDIGVAINRTWTPKGGGDKREETCFVDCTAWGKTGETIAKFLKKGDPIHLEGRLTFDSWKDQNGNNRSKLKVTIDQFQFVGGRNENSAAPNPCKANVPAATTVSAPSDEDIPF